MRRESQAKARLLALAIPAGLTWLALPACQEDQGQEKETVEEKMEEAGDEAQGAIEDTAEEVEDAAEEVSEGAEEAFDNLESDKDDSSTGSGGG